ncbi:AzlD domain-containing protein [Protaetiibacter intestinalis]|uniref:AzlD domain-containing protein n=1 Tax=Protaetiibacter intestinalis TaxID=2419774 RepID=A0A387BBX7_9MICO|nr:AzlD domain-containing protein [Protaetiibacter intestinalis]AYF98656.1 AzlD domain-containing protein [Protaetiibacter intestinalis]
MLDALAILLGGIATYLTRVLFLVSRKLRPPPAVQRYLPLVGPAVLGAIAIPGLVAPGGELSLLTTGPSLLAAAAAWASWRLARRQMVVGLLVGLAVWWGCFAVLGALGLR